MVRIGWYCWTKGYETEVRQYLAAVESWAGVTLRPVSWALIWVCLVLGHLKKEDEDE